MTDAEIEAGGGAPVKVPEGERQDLQITARELGQWQGGVDQRLLGIDENVRKLNASIGVIQDGIATIKTYMATTTGGQTAQERQQRQAQTWRMWAIGLAATAALAFGGMFLTVVGFAIYLATK